MLRVGLTGGIGSGKSTAARIFTALGVPVYDSDSRAKMLMHGEAVKPQITAVFGESAYKEGKLDTAYISSLAFTDKSLLSRLNSIVHPQVMDDFGVWAAGHEREGYACVVQENAILFDHGFDDGMDYTVTISAPEPERIARAALRDGRDPRDVKKRIANQMTDLQRERLADFTVHNGERDLLVPQVTELHERFMAGTRI